LLKITINYIFNEYMDSIKEIEIGQTKPKKKLSKKQKYKELLSSKTKLKELIGNRNKTKRFDYLNMIPKVNKNTSEPLSNNVQKSPNNLETHLKKASSPPVQKQLPPSPPPLTLALKHLSTDIKKPIPKKVQFKQKKSKDKSNIKEDNSKKIEEYFNKATITKQNGRKHPPTLSKVIPKKFTQEQILEMLRILLKLKKYEQYQKIHKAIRRINRVQTIQLLFTLRLISYKSKAPLNMLKNILFGYLVSDIQIER
jgi:hypothetical protein